MNQTIMITIIVCATLLIGWLGFLFFQNQKTKNIIESDMAHKEIKNGKEVIGKIRSRWDYSYVPELSRAFFKLEPSLVVAVILLLILIGLFALFRENSFLELFKYNVGATLGLLIKGRISDEKIVKSNKNT